MEQSGQLCVSAFFNSALNEDVDMYDLCEEAEQSELNNSFYDDEIYNISAVVETLNPSTQEVGGGLKRTPDIQEETEIIPSKRPRIQEGPSTSSSSRPLANSDQVNRGTFQLQVSSRYFANHSKTNIHKKNNLKLHNSLEHVTVAESAFGQKIITYQIKSNSDSSIFETPELFLNSIKNDILVLIKESTQKHIIFKTNFILNADFVQQTKNITNTFDFQTCNYIISQGDDLNIFLSSLRDTLTDKISALEKKDSGWSLKQIKCIHMTVNKFNPLRGSTYIELPADIKAKTAVINVKNLDNLCFKWALLSALYPVAINMSRVSSYSVHANKLKFNGVSFPVKFNDIPKIEELNDISINVFGLELNRDTNKHNVVGPLFMTKSRKSRHVNLLYIHDGTNNHYCYIKNLSRLVSKQVSNHEHRVYICDGCLLRFPTEESLTNHQQHDCFHVSTELPSNIKTSKDWFGESVSNDKLKFDKFQKKLKIPFVVYADFEAFLKPLTSCPNDPSNNVNKHDVYSFGYYIKCSYDDSLSKYETYSGPNSAQVFMDRLFEDLKIILKKNSFKKCPKPLSTEDENIINNSKNCYICETDLKQEIELYYDWHMGDFRGVAHEVCMAKFRTPRHIPVFLHNLSHYAHFIIHAFNSVDGNVEVIPQNKERYISFSKTLNINYQRIDLRFVDSFKFLSCSLDQLADNLKDEQFYTLKSKFPCDEDFSRLRKKRIYPYELMTSYDCLKLTTLPSQEQFYSSLSDSNVSDDDYNHALDVWQHFKCRTMLDYSDLYLKTDVLVLSDVFENFRNICIETYDLDPAHYYTAPGLSWDAMLKHTQIELDLLTDFDKLAFIKAGVRGGVSQCSNRYAKANNEFLEDFDETKPKSYLAYFDANNLYGWAMSQFLPEGSFEWVSTDTNFKVSDTSEYGFILEVDLEYPVELHDLHSDLPLCPESICAGNSEEKKLIPNLNNKIKYTIHYRNLKQCLQMGIKLVKIHRILKFRQSPWLERYIDLNTKLRTKATTDFEKDFYKLMNNSVFGKTIENIENRVHVKLLTRWENRGKSLGAQDSIAKPEFHSLSIFDENLVAVQLRKTKLFYNKPIYLGFCILDISKTRMYDFHYNYMLNKFSNRTKLLYTDTDSLIYQIFTDNFYEDIKPDIATRFDTSDYPPDNIFGFPNLNKKKIGFFKDENNGKIMKEFVGLRSKMYMYEVENKLTAKCCMSKFKSMKHTILTEQNKACSSYNDTKRHILPNQVDTLAWGHYKLS